MFDRSGPRRTGLTLIEIIVVIAIIAILITITVAMGQHIINSNNRKATETVLEALASATDRYRIERGYWPWEEYSGFWEVELTRTIEPAGSPNAGAVRTPYFTAGTPVLRETCMAYGEYPGTMVTGATGTVPATCDPWPGNMDRTAGAYCRIFDNWGNRIYLNLPTSPLGLANQGLPVFQSAGSSGVFGGSPTFQTFTTTNVFQNSNNVFSHCGTDN